MTAERTFPTTGQDSDESHETTRLQADGGTLAGPHDTPGPLPDAGDDERTLFQAAVDGAICRVNPPGGWTGIQARDRDPSGAIRVWVSSADHNPTPRVSVAVEDDREVVTISASAWPTADALREWASSIRGECGGSETTYVDGGSVHVRSDGGGAEIWDESDDGSLSVTRLARSRVTVGAGTGDSWASVRLVDDDGRDELAHAAETAAEVRDP